MNLFDKMEGIVTLPHRNELNIPICSLDLSDTSVLCTLDNCPKQNLLTLDGSV